MFESLICSVKTNEETNEETNNNYGTGIHGSGLWRKKRKNG